MEAGLLEVLQGGSSIANIVIGFYLITLNQRVNRLENKVY